MIWEKNVSGREKSASERMSLGCFTRRKRTSLARAQRLRVRRRNEVGKGRVI